MSVIDSLKTSIFSTPMPDMPPLLREMWQVAFMFRRKYSNPCGKDVESFFSSAWNDAQFISESYGRNETMQSLLAEVYLDIERQWKVVQARQQND